MKEYAINNERRITKDDIKLKKISELERWFKTEYIYQNLELRRKLYLGVSQVDKTLYALEVEAHNKEQELRRLKGIKPLPEIKVNKII